VFSGICRDDVIFVAIGPTLHRAKIVLYYLYQRRVILYEVVT